MQKKTIFFLLVLIFCQQITYGQAKEAQKTLITKIDQILNKEIAQENIPGAVIMIKQENKELFKKAYGYAQLYNYDNQRLKNPEKTTIEHLYDLASLTKVIGTTTAIMILADKGLIKIDDPVSDYINGFDSPDKHKITIRHLLTHSAGLYEWYPTYYFSNNRADTYQLVHRLPLKYPVGKSRHYSDLGFMLLGEIIETVSKQSLEEYMEEHIFIPLGMENTGYDPLKNMATDKIAATSHGNPFEKRMVSDATLGFKVDSIDPDQWNGWRKYTLKGEVNDGNAWYANDGISGHAGLFSNVEDLQKLIDVLQQRGKTPDGQFITENTIKEFFSPDKFQNGLGWVMDTNSAIIKDAPKGSFGHTGFTGTSIAVVPKYNISVILLINRQNLGLLKTRKYYNLNPIREKIFKTVMEYRKEQRN